MNRLERLERGLLKQSVPDIKIGATVRVHVKIIEGEKERIQVYEGVVIRKKGTRNRETFTVRKVSYGVGVERVFPIHSPYITQIDVVREGKVNRAKLYYLRERTGQAARISEREKAVQSEPKATSPVEEPQPVKVES
jgi:large subunit ribosomal protein L19